jgi:uncharacterized membrane protein (DUF106 family)
MFGVDDIISVGMKILDKVIPDPAAKAEAQAKLIEIQQQGRLAELQADTAEAQELTKRQESDMASDSWLSKNIRPMSLIAIFLAYFLFTMMSAFGYDAKESYVQLLGTWGQLIFGFYFGSRCLEKLTEMRTKAKDGTNNA